MLNPLPPKARIGHRTYSLKLWPRKEADVAGARGIHEANTHIIRLQEDLEPCDGAETLIHELLHACWRNVNLTGTSDTEEVVVSTLAENLAQVFADNPDVVKWIMHNLRR